MSYELDLNMMDELVIVDGLKTGQITQLDRGKLKCPYPGCGHDNHNPFNGLPKKVEKTQLSAGRCSRCRRNLIFVLRHTGDTDGEKAFVYCLKAPSRRQAKVPKRMPRSGSRTIPMEKR